MPLITVFIPIVDSERPISLGQPKAVLTCLRTNVLNEGSLPVAQLNETLGTSISSAANKTTNGTTVSSPESALPHSSTGKRRVLSASTIASIVVGLVLGLALVVFSTMLLVRWRRSQNLQAPTTMPKYLSEMDNTTTIKELGDSARQKGDIVSELDSSKYRSELGTFEEPLELPAHPYL